MTNEERQHAIEWFKRRPVMMAGAKRMYDLAVEALEAYVPGMNVGETEPSSESDTEIARCSDDTISRQAAIDALCRGEGCGNVCRRAIKTLPTVQPEIIRCRNCKHWDKTWTNDWLPDYHYCPMIDEVRKGDFYCADAERRTDG